MNIFLFDTPTFVVFDLHNFLYTSMAHMPAGAGGSFDSSNSSGDEVDNGALVLRPVKKDAKGR